MSRGIKFSRTGKLIDSKGNSDYTVSHKYIPFYTMKNLCIRDRKEKTDQAYYD